MIPWSPTKMMFILSSKDLSFKPFHNLPIMLSTILTWAYVCNKKQTLKRDAAQSSQPYQGLHPKITHRVYGKRERPKNNLPFKYRFQTDKACSFAGLCLDCQQSLSGQSRRRAKQLREKAETWRERAKRGPAPLPQSLLALILQRSC